MSRSGLLYFSIVVILVSGAFNFFDHAGSAPNTIMSDEFMQHRWVITEVRDLEDVDLIAEYNATIWQFLTGGHFVQFRNDIIAHSGQWMIKGNTLELEIDGEHSKEIYDFERIRRNELMLKSDKLQVRLLKLSD